MSRLVLEVTFLYVEVFEYSFYELSRGSGAYIVFATELYTESPSTLINSPVEYFRMYIHIFLYLVHGITDNESRFWIGVFYGESHVTLFHHYLGMSIENHRKSFIVLIVSLC